MNMRNNYSGERSFRQKNKKFSLIDRFSTAEKTGIHELTLMATDIKISVFSKHFGADISVRMNYFIHNSFAIFLIEKRTGFFDV